MARSKKALRKRSEEVFDGYDTLLADLVAVVEDSRRAAARSVNAVMTATYWLIGRRIVEVEQGGQSRAEYGEASWSDCLPISPIGSDAASLARTCSRCANSTSSTGQAGFARQCLANLPA
jgi:DUF1016 N-terminal domain